MSRIKIAIEARFLAIPANWTRHKSVAHDEKGEHAEYFFAPEVNQKAEPALIEDPWKLRNDFLRMKHTEDAAFRFLSKVGVWNVVAGQRPQIGLEKTALEGAFGLRWFQGRALPLTLEELWAEQEHWSELLSPQGRAKLRARFTPRPSDAAWFALQTQFENTLPVHIEWRAGERQYPHAVVQPMTGRELLTATAWIDLVRGAKFQVCENENCGISFSGRKRQHCSESCAHVVAVRAFRERQRKAKRKRG
jgi:hypothetical protein